MIGVGVRVDANLRTGGIFTKIDGRLEGLSQKFAALSEIVTMIDTVREDIGEWRQEFLTKSVTIGRIAFKPYLDSASGLWEQLSDHWGKGSGYRMKVITDVKNWFEQNAQLADARLRAESRLHEAWREIVLERLRDAMSPSELQSAS